VRCLPSLVITPRLTLRRWTPEDAPALAHAVEASIDHLRPWMPWVADEPLPGPERVALLEQFNREWLAGGDVIYGAFARDTVVGGCGLHRRRGPTTLEIGYWLHVDHTGRGYATELARSLTTTGLAEPGIAQVEIHHDLANVASRRIPERLGFHLASQEPDEVRAPAEVGIDCTWVAKTPPR
jgi:ribosomal-protein-serine acetyltransferase